MAKRIRKSTFRIMKVPSKELCVFMIWIIDVRSARHIMNMHRRPPTRHHDADI
jgi:hypothetical protein